MAVPQRISQKDAGASDNNAAFLRAYQERHSSGEAFLANLPFAGHDATGGTEHELQAMVVGRGKNVDLVRTIADSNFFSNIEKRAAAGDVSSRNVDELRNFLEDGPDQTWENSWVRFRRNLLNIRATRLLLNDLRADKGRADSPVRSDADRFLVEENGAEWLRVPISYLLKLALADLLGGGVGQPEYLQRLGESLLENFTNDNSSPETVSFYVCRTRKTGRLGRELAEESALRFLLSQTLAAYANSRFLLRETGQTVCVHFAPLPGSRLKKLNSLLPDSYYRELFMSPCLSGWQRGEEKHRYMGLCHQTLTRSQLNCIGKLKEAGIITRNLVVLPNTSNISLANNGVHISLGSSRLANRLGECGGEFGAPQEKYFGDLAIKIVEHFLPLFVGTYSAAPYRLDYSDFHPEIALGFLPHELDYTHLRMLWRRWKKKAAIRVAGQPLTPFGPASIDRLLSRIFRLKGDYVPDFRLVDYFVSLLSTDRCPALDGQNGNLDRLKHDLDSHGVFDRHMAPYLLYRLRHFGEMGYSGFEGRYYSIFASFTGDMAEAADLQVLLTALAFRLIFSGSLRHADIPDNPTVESERRQIFFGAALGIPTFFVHRESSNRFLRAILAQVPGIRSSRRYPGYLRVQSGAYRLALVRYLRREEKPLVEMMRAEELLVNLEGRLAEGNGLSVESALRREVMGRSGKSSPLDLPASAFNRELEEFYRHDLRLLQIDESCGCLAAQIKRTVENSLFSDSDREALNLILQGESLACFVDRASASFRKGEEDHARLRRLAQMIILAVSLRERDYGGRPDEGRDAAAPCPVYRIGGKG